MLSSNEINAVVNKINKIICFRYTKPPIQKLEFNEENSVNTFYETNEKHKRTIIKTRNK